MPTCCKYFLSSSTTTNQLNKTFSDGSVLAVKFLYICMTKPMKMKKVLTILTVLLATTLSCKKEKEVNCDCDAEVISTYSGPQNQPLMSLQHLCTGEVKDSITKTNTNWTVGEVTCIDLW